MTLFEKIFFDKKIEHIKKTYSNVDFYINLTGDYTVLNTIIGDSINE